MAAAKVSRQTLSEWIRSKLNAIICRMDESRKCIATFRAGAGVEHAAEITASSLYEAAALALKRLRRSDWSRDPSFEAGTLRVEVWEQLTAYRVSIAALEKWLDGVGCKPRDVALRQKLRGILDE